MSMKVEIWFNTEEFPLFKDSYKFKPVNVETINETEAGTKIRDIKRLGVPHISISQIVDDTWYQKLFDYFASGSSITVKYYDPHTLTQKTYSAFLEDLDFELIKDDGTSTEWQVSFEVTAY